ncbi:MAG: response regulator [bacterium]|nr:response regulator [bacterium]
MYTSKLRGIICLGLLLAAPQLDAQRHLLRTYSEDDGLPSATVHDVLQDGSGRMWFATRSGVAVYDGTHFELLKDGLPELAVVDIDIDDAGSIWGLGGRGPDSVSVMRLDGQDRWSLLPDPRIGAAKCWERASLAVTRDERGLVVALGTAEAGLHMWRDEGWTRFAAPGLAEQVREVTARRGRVYAASSHGLFVVEGPRIRDHWTGQDAPTPELYAVALEELGPGDEDLRIWLLGAGWIGALEPGGFRLLWQDERSLVDLRFRAVLEPDGTGGVLVGQPMTLRHLPADRATLRALGPAHGLAGDGATAFHTDHEGNLWIASWRGVSKIVGRRFTNFTRLDGLLEDEVTAIVELSPGSLLLGHNRGLTRFTGREAVVIPFPEEEIHSIVDARVMDLVADGRGAVWAAVSSWGVGRYQPRRRIRWYREGLRKEIAALVIDAQGTMWAGGEDGIFRFDGDRFAAVAHPLPPAAIRRIAIGGDGTLYFATAGEGLYSVRDGDWRQHRSAEGAVADQVYTVLVDHRGRVLAGSRAGLYTMRDGVLRDGVLERFRSGELELDYPVYLLIEDQRRRLWIGTDNGVVRWDGVKARTYRRHDGLSGREVNRAAGWVDAAGRVWIGTSQGLSRYDEAFDREPLPPRVELLSVEAGGRKLPLREALVLAHDENDPTFHFRAVSFVDETAVEYSGMLEGFDHDWLPPIRSFEHWIRYSHVPPGGYRFLLRARGPAGGWSDMVSSAEITIRYPFWRTWWFVVLSVLAAGGMLFAFIRGYAAHRYSRSLEAQVRGRTRALEDSCRQLSESTEQLRREVTERERTEEQLRRAKDGAEAASRAKSRFLATMSHEIRTPMTGVLGMTWLLLETQLSTEQRDRAEKIRKSGEALLTVIDDILDYSKIEAGKLDLALEPFDVAACMTEVLDLFAAQADDKGIELQQRIESGVPAWVVGDDSRVRQILVNLVGNAVKFTERGFVELLAKAEEGDGQGEEQSFLLLLTFSIRDTGIGIPEEKRGRLFEPFSQVDSSTRRRYGGTGLGLVICHRLVERMEGRIGVDSREGEGSTFFFTIPVRSASPPVAPSAEEGRPQIEARHGSLPPLRILVAEDNLMNQQIAVEILKRMGCRVDVAVNGREVLEALERHSYDLVFMDVEMPEMDGLEATREIRRRHAPSAQPRIVAMTAHALRENHDECLAAGMNDVLTKPISIPAVLAAVELWGARATEGEERSSSRLVER